MKPILSKKPEGDGPWIIAHRGARDEAPENTAAAFKRALRYPIDGIELDVQMSADGIPLLYHDRTLRKVAGTGRRVSDFPWQSLCRLDAGTWFSPEFSKEKLMSFDEMLGLLAGRTRLFIEIKSRPIDRAAGRQEQLADAVAGRLRALDVARNREEVFLLSFDLRVLERVQALDSGFPSVLILSRMDARSLRHLPKASQERLAAFCVELSATSPELVSWAHSGGKRVFTYTCNGLRQVRKALKAGVDGIITDRPGWLSGIFRNPGAKASFPGAGG